MISSLIHADQDFALWAVLLIAATLGIGAERTRLGARVSGVVVTLLVTFILSNLRIIPASAPTYEAVWSGLVPLAIPLLLFRADVFRILRDTGPTLLAYGCGAIGTVVGTVVAYAVLPLGEAGWQLAGIFCATYIGGSINFAATAEMVGLRSGELLTAGIAADNLMMMVYFLVLFALPSLGWLQQLFSSRRSRQDSGAGMMPLNPFGSMTQKRQGLHLFEVSQALAISALICAVGYGLATVSGFKDGGILVVTVLIVALATSVPGYFGQLEVAETLGTLLMQIFFAAIGASANIGAVLQVGPILLALAAVILAIHLLFLLLTGRLLGLELAELTIASNANMGGPTTAAAMAVSQRWPQLVTPAILCGTLGYAIATFLGAGLGNLLHAWGS